jgi:hypothetical protein
VIFFDNGFGINAGDTVDVKRQQVCRWLRLISLKVYYCTLFPHASYVSALGTRRCKDPLGTERTSVSERPSSRARVRHWQQNIVQAATRRKRPTRPNHIPSCPHRLSFLHYLSSSNKHRGSRQWNVSVGC